jgi:hypothetical protein
MVSALQVAPECLTGPAKVIDGDIIVVADQLVRL